MAAANIGRPNLMHDSLIAPAHPQGNFHALAHGNFNNHPHNNFHARPHGNFNAHHQNNYHAPAPVYKPAPVYHAPAPAYRPAHHANSYHEPAYETPAHYEYGYAVLDDYSGANFEQHENRDGYATNGEYRVNLPDGRTQIVTYQVGDEYSGYIADVRYEGEAHYAPYEPKPHEPRHPAPFHA